MRALLTLLAVVSLAAVTIVGLGTVVYVACLTTGHGYGLVVDPVHELLGTLLAVGRGRRAARQAQGDSQAAGRGAAARP
jgi:hypothetical protein